MRTRPGAGWRACAGRRGGCAGTVGLRRPRQSALHSQCRIGVRRASIISASRRARRSSGGKLPLRAWVLAIFVMTMHRTEEASLPVICQTLAVNRRTAGSMIRRIRRGTTYRLASTNPQLVAWTMFQQAEKRTPDGAVPWPLQKGDLVREKAGGPVMVIMEVYPDRQSARCRRVEGVGWTDTVFRLDDLQRVTRLSKPVT